jgi:hypothetical protein
MVGEHPEQVGPHAASAELRVDARRQRRPLAVARTIRQSAADDLAIDLRQHHQPAGAIEVADLSDGRAALVRQYRDPHRAPGLVVGVGDRRPDSRGHDLSLPQLAGKGSRFCEP